LTVIRPSRYDRGVMVSGAAFIESGSSCWVFLSADRLLLDFDYRLFVKPMMYGLPWKRTGAYSEEQAAL